MPHTLTIHPTLATDLPALKQIIEAVHLFPPEMLDEMCAKYLVGEDPSLWLTARSGGTIAGLCHAMPEQMASGTWNASLLAVCPSHQGRGIGPAIMAYVERHLAAAGHRLMLVEVSSLPEYERTRRFCLRLGFREEARIQDFFHAGEDKLIYWKALTALPTESTP